MELVIEGLDSIIYKVGNREFIMIDKTLDSVICIFHKHDDLIYNFVPGSAYCFSCHDSYLKVINQIK